MNAEDKKGPKGSDATVSNAEKALLSFQVAQEAKKQIITWAKWILAVCALILAILGIQYQSTMRQLDDRMGFFNCAYRRP